MTDDNEKTSAELYALYKAAKARERAIKRQTRPNVGSKIADVIFWMVLFFLGALVTGSLLWFLVWATGLTVNGV